MGKLVILAPAYMSLPSWERGLKYKNLIPEWKEELVAPFVGAWIEMLSGRTGNTTLTVAPFVGAWIEML